MMGLPTRLARAPSLLLARSQTTSATPDPALPFSAIPLAPGAWPILGHLPFMANKKTQARMHIAIENLRKESGDIFKLSIPGETDSVIIFNPDDINTMYSNDGKVPHIIGFEVFEHLRHVMKDRYTTKGLLSNGEDWYTVRHQIQQDMMRPKSALFYINDMDELAEELVTKISGDMGASGSGIPDIHPLMQAYALEAVGCIFLGSKLGTIRGEGDGKRLIDIADEMLPIIQNLIFLPKPLRPLMPSFKRMISLQEEMFDTSKKHVDAAISRITDDDESVIAKLVRACGPGSPVPLIMGIDALQAGIDTTGTSAAVLLYHLADNPDKQDILYQEICDTIGPQGKVTESSLGKMRYLKACQTESQRILPAVFGSSRRTAVDLVMSGYEVPKGTNVIRMGHSTSNDPESFKNPEKFVPERWLRNSSERHCAHAFANIPWGHGARSCIGRRFAQLELYMLMVKVVQRFRMEQDGGELGLLTKFVSVPDRPVNIKFVER